MPDNKKTAVVLFNLGGPADLDSVEQFLFNLFYDRAIIRLPNPFRWFIAKLISKTRAGTAKKIYGEIGGASPIIRETKKQAEALKKALGKGFEVFVSMRYAPPMSDEVAAKIKEYDPDQIVMLPLYPQFSTTTTESSVQNFETALKKFGISKSLKLISSYQTSEGFINAHVELISRAIDKISDKSNIRILFSAHGLPQKIVDAGDPYQKQVEETVAAIMDRLDHVLDYRITYQSRVGPMKWLEPATCDEIKNAALAQKIIVVVPVAFVSEHVETLVELDIEYAKVAKDLGALYIRIPALGTHKSFIEDLAKKVRIYGDLL